MRSRVFFAGLVVLLALAAVDGKAVSFRRGKAAQALERGYRKLEAAVPSQAAVSRVRVEKQHRRHDRSGWHVRLCCNRRSRLEAVERLPLAVRRGRGGATGSGGSPATGGAVASSGGAVTGGSTGRHRWNEDKHRGTLKGAADL